ncbi:hypothetical protein K438DRAFT_2180680 [Mycena galopus ATCC 62051]|nr:hypothetical protein K438DRAFT_2180680 [Mycena galopus ATCC 62051]
MCYFVGALYPRTSASGSHKKNKYRAGQAEAQGRPTKLQPCTGNPDHIQKLGGEGGRGRSAAGRKKEQCSPLRPSEKSRSFHPPPPPSSLPFAAFSLPAHSLRGHQATVARHIPNPSPSSLSHRQWGSLVTVPPPLPAPSPPPSSIPAAATAAAPPAMEPTVSVASKKACRPNPIHFTLRNLYMAVYADEMGGSSHKFTQHWLSLATENPGRFQAHETYSKELVMYYLLLSGLYLICIYRSFRSSRTYLLLKIFDNASKLFSEVPFHRRLASNGSVQRSGG